MKSEWVSSKRFCETIRDELFASRDQTVVQKTDFGWNKIMYPRVFFFVT